MYGPGHIYMSPVYVIGGPISFGFVAITSFYFGVPVDDIANRGDHRGHVAFVFPSPALRRVDLAKLLGNERRVAAAPPNG